MGSKQSIRELSPVIFRLASPQKGWRNSRDIWFEDSARDVAWRIVRGEANSTVEGETEFGDLTIFTPAGSIDFNPQVHHVYRDHFLRLLKLGLKDKGLTDREGRWITAWAINKPYDDNLLKIYQAERKTLVDDLTRQMEQAVAEKMRNA